MTDWWTVDSRIGSDRKSEFTSFLCWQKSICWRKCMYRSFWIQPPMQNWSNSMNRIRSSSQPKQTVYSADSRCRSGFCRNCSWCTPWKNRAGQSCCGHRRRSRRSWNCRYARSAMWTGNHYRNASADHERWRSSSNKIHERAVFPKRSSDSYFYKTFEIGDHMVTAEKTGKIVLENIDTVIIAVGVKTDRTLLDSMEHVSCKVLKVGDANGWKRISWNPGRIRGRIECVKRKERKNGRSSKRLSKAGTWYHSSCRRCRQYCQCTTVRDQTRLVLKIPGQAEKNQSPARRDHGCTETGTVSSRDRKSCGRCIRGSFLRTWNKQKQNRKNAQKEKKTC